MNAAEKENEDGIVWFDPVNWLAAIMGALSFCHLVSEAYQIGFGPVLRSILERYEIELARIAIVFEPMVRGLFEFIRSLFDWRLELYDHWKHVFVLLMVYFAARYTSAFKKGNWGAAWIMVFSGLGVGALGSIGAGTTPLAAASDAVVQNVVIMTVFPTVSVFVFDFIEIVWTSTVRRSVQARIEGDANLQSRQVFFRLSRRVLERSGGALALIGVAVGLSFLPTGAESVPSPGLSLLLALIVRRQMI